MVYPDVVRCTTFAQARSYQLFALRDDPFELPIVRESNFTELEWIQLWKVDGSKVASWNPAPMTCAGALHVEELDLHRLEPNFWQITRNDI